MIYMMLVFAMHAHDCHGFTTMAHFQAAYCSSQYTIEASNNRIDCVEPDSIHTYAWAKDWKQAIGRALFSQSQYPDRGVVIRLIAYPGWDDGNALARAAGVVDRYNLPIEFRNLYCSRPLY